MYSVICAYTSWTHPLVHMDTLRSESQHSHARNQLWTLHCSQTCDVINSVKARDITSSDVRENKQFAEFITWVSLVYSMNKGMDWNGSCSRPLKFPQNQPFPGNLLLRSGPICKSVNPTCLLFKISYRLNLNYKSLVVVNVNNVGEWTLCLLGFI